MSGEPSPNAHLLWGSSGKFLRGEPCPAREGGARTGAGGRDGGSTGRTPAAAWEQPQSLRPASRWRLAQPGLGRGWPCSWGLDAGGSARLQSSGSLVFIRREASGHTDRQRDASPPGASVPFSGSSAHPAAPRCCNSRPAAPRQTLKQLRDGKRRMDSDLRAQPSKSV